MWRWPITIVLAMWLAGATACTSELETGYKPRGLGATEAQRRGFYADRFSPEARAAEEEAARTGSNPGRRTGTGGIIAPGGHH